ncbi:MAG TPA: glutathione S-transferase family protein [Kofleriaceae bacterium]|nr:glutathione S-transferase family protein [Kofleriaceae bacterium]
MTQLTLVARSSSHFSRTARMFALELGVPHTFRPVLDLTSRDIAVYADNPALKVPILVDESGPLFGTENICRALARRSDHAARAVLRGDTPARIVANAEELVLHVMSSEVTVVMAKFTGAVLPAKVTASIENCLDFLDAHLDAVLAALATDRLTSFFEVALFCTATHLPWREVMDVARWTRLGDFVRSFGQRDSALATEYRFDAA